MTPASFTVTTAATRGPVPRARLSNVLLVALALLAMSGTATADGLAGHWRLNDALTRELQPAQKAASGSTSGFGQPVVVVGGMPVPLPGTSAPQPGLGGPSPDPMVMRCAELTVTPAGEELLLEFHGVGSERLRRGNVQGLKSRWNDRKLTTRYATTTRTVSQTWEVNRDGRLVVTVKLNPDHGKTQTHKRVFDRIEG
jgi:hypothetical protein